MTCTPRPLFATLLVFLATASLLAHPAPPSTPSRSDTTSQQSPLLSSSPDAMVVTDAPLATAVGLQTLREGGNAIDAAVSTAFALAVVWPAAGNIGGGGFLVARFATGASVALDFRETAPLASQPTMYLDSSGHVTHNAVTGYRSAGVPGSVAGLWEAHRKFGSQPWKRLLQPAIALAAKGFIIDDAFAATLIADSARLAQFPASRKLFFRGTRLLHAGDHWRNPDLAAVLRRIATRGASEFYAGRTARRIVNDMQRHHGLITRRDLARYRARWRTPLSFVYRGDTVITMPLPSAGGITLALTANIIGGFNLQAMGWHTPLSLQILAESLRRAFADRNSDLGDPAFVHVPLDTLLSAEYAAQRRQSISFTHATPSRDVAGFSEGMHTTHFSIVDPQGNAVAVTTTINLLYGSGVTVTGAGFLLNDEMDDFAVKPSSPNAFGLVQGTANAIAPGKRMLSSMTPTIGVDRQGSVFLVTGASGGPRIISAVFQVLSNVIDFGLPIDSAVSAPRIHLQHLPDSLYVEEDGFAPALLDSLRARGYAIAPLRHIGITASILRWKNLWWGATEPRIGR